MYLLDTMVISETMKRRPHTMVQQWLSKLRPEDGYLSVMSIGELERGLAKAAEHDADYAVRLSAWIKRIEIAFGDRILNVDTEIARAWGKLAWRVGNKTSDILLAATAIVHDLTVVTRNVRHFDRTGVAILNPYTEPA